MFLPVKSNTTVTCGKFLVGWLQSTNFWKYSQLLQKYLIKDKYIFKQPHVCFTTILVSFLKSNNLTYLDDYSHVAWCMFSYTLVAECHRGQGGKSPIHHNNKLTHQNLEKQITKEIYPNVCVFALLY